MNSNALKMILGFFNIEANESAGKIFGTVQMVLGYLVGALVILGVIGDAVGIPLVPASLLPCLPVD